MNKKKDSRMKLYIAAPDMGLDNGVGQVLKYHRLYLEKLGVQFVKNSENADVTIEHLGIMPGADIHYSHGLYFGQIDDGRAKTNAKIIEAIRKAKAIICPSEYVAETFRRDLRIEPYVIGHGVEYREWQSNLPKQDYILWNKNRASDVCNPRYMNELARHLPRVKFLSTFGEPFANVRITGRLPFDTMQKLIMQSQIYLSTTKETFCIGALEAMASGSPILGFAIGGVKDIVTHKEDGYLVGRGDIQGLVTGYQYIMENYDIMSNAAKRKAKSYSWQRVAVQLLDVFETVKENKNAMGL